MELILLHLVLELQPAMPGPQVWAQSPLPWWELLPLMLALLSVVEAANVSIEFKHLSKRKPQSTIRKKKDDKKLRFSFTLYIMIQQHSSQFKLSRSGQLSVKSLCLVSVYLSTKYYTIVSHDQPPACFNR